MNNTKNKITKFKNIIDDGMKKGNVSLKLFPRETDPEKFIVIVNNLSGKILYDRKKAADMFGVKNYGDVMKDLWKKYSGYKTKNCRFVVLDHTEKQKNGEEIAMFYIMEYSKGVRNVRKWWYE